MVRMLARFMALSSLRTQKLPAKPWISGCLNGQPVTGHLSEVFFPDLKWYAHFLKFSFDVADMLLRFICFSYLSASYLILSSALTLSYL